MTEKRKTKNADLNLSPKEKSICPVIAKGKTKLSRVQSEYNRLTKKITALKEDIKELPMREKVIIAFYEEKARSLFEKESQLKSKKLKTEEMEESLMDYFFGDMDDFEKIWK